MIARIGARLQSEPFAEAWLITLAIFAAYWVYNGHLGGALFVAGLFMGGCSLIEIAVLVTDPTVPADKRQAILWRTVKRMFAPAVALITIGNLLALLPSYL